ncbi:PepSY domain-containing protein [Hwanghaeella grinnelliae]|uniref:PepSY domain-containing protein n=1 Tax=Hwanghaeella grinnelliae TaxID=2500179 RepID=A0A3S2ZAN0_9PROT|nr:PepSY domain-containing protein [Hwanghaeella grinnelliae]RVU38214.1 PepSY domain-containing protein [Hwanghaeella grinnelliae]
MKGLRALCLTGSLLLVAGSPVWASDDLTEEEIERINAVLGEMQCEMDDDDIEKEDDGFDLDDVLCAEGQFDIKLDTDFAVVEKRAE